MHKQTLLFFCSRFGGGGAEMHLLRILSHSDPLKYNIHLALTRGGGNYEERLPAHITVHYLTDGRSSSLVALIKSYGPLKALVKKLIPDAVISIMDPQNILLSFLKKSQKAFPKIILICQNAPIKNLSNENIRGKFFLLVLPKLYQYANRIIAICNGVKNELKNDLKITAPIHTIYNAGYDESYDQLKNEQLSANITSNAVQLVACGRLTKQKGFDILLKALAIIKNNIDFNLWIIGDGEDKAELIKQRDSLGLNSHVQLLGYQSNPYKFFNVANIFVLSSRWEGFGNVITEAMVCGCAIVSTNCDFGPNEILEHEQTGLLCEVDNEVDLALNIKRAIYDFDLRKKIINNGIVRAKMFSSAEIGKQYFEEIALVLQ